MFAVFGKYRAEEEKRRRLIYNKEDSKWYEDTRKWKRLSNSRYQISPEYSTIETAEEFVRQSQEMDGKTVWKPVKSILKRK